MITTTEALATRPHSSQTDPRPATRSGTFVIGVNVRTGNGAYFRGSTASFSCFAIRALTTVLAGILMASPVAGLRPIRAFRF